MDLNNKSSSIDEVLDNFLLYIVLDPEDQHNLKFIESYSDQIINRAFQLLGSKEDYDAQIGYDALEVIDQKYWINRAVNTIKSKEYDNVFGTTKALLKNVKLNRESMRALKKLKPSTTSKYLKLSNRSQNKLDDILDFQYYYHK